ncbi:MAG TPA: C-type lectin domain-containing protein [Polyangiales bacterium]
MRTRVARTTLLVICAAWTPACATILGIDDDYREVSEKSLDAGGVVDNEGGMVGNEGGMGGNEGGMGGNDAGSTPFCEAHGGVIWDGHCYFLLDGGAFQPWTKAKPACAAFPSTHLVTITSAQEQAFLEARFFPAAEDMWIGLAVADTSQLPPKSCTTTANSCPYFWVTGEKLAYTDWTQRSGGGSEPDYNGGCARLLHKEKTWADLDCTTSLPALCESD